MSGGLGGGGGKLVGWARSEFGNANVLTGTTVIAYQDTPFTSAQGAAFAETVTYTPKSLDNFLRITLFVNYHNDVSNTSFIGLFYNAVTPAVAVWSHNQTFPQLKNFQHVMQVPTLAAMTFKVRCGTSWSGSAYNMAQQMTAAQDFGGMTSFFWLVEEFAP